MLGDHLRGCCIGPDERRWWFGLYRVEAMEKWMALRAYFGGISSKTWVESKGDGEFKDDSGFWLEHLGGWWVIY